ncbi:hypothetical protein L1077_26205 [Pseudoalteromonas luteoviolacea]|uniref:DUF7683 domain-containing protein n=1 Tax=Pseudoalteromonas luteoviolacea TaxID=43657 RepID=UPI001F3D29B9|nr:hypothetical protein [Pseudoalteromonas luteoviolacea]MCF6442921.1 hypothetical protein [Pseudoalteromonas luteoviolacea]
MSDAKFKVRRFISEYSQKAEVLIAEYELSELDLFKLKAEFDETNPEQAMFDCYEIRKSNVSFINKYTHEPIAWDFSKNAYFIEANYLSD